MIGFLDENQGRAYPFQPDIPDWLRPLIVDAQFFYGPDEEFDVALDQVVLYEIAESGTDWLFDFRIRRGTLRFPLVVTVPASATPFSTHHVATANNWSYVFLTVCDMSLAQPWQAASAADALPIEDRCIVAPGFQAVTAVDVWNGLANKSIREYFDYLSATDPAVNYTAAAAQWAYDPNVLDTQLSSLVNAIPFEAGANAQVFTEDGKIIIRLREEAGTGRDCCFVLDDDETMRHTFRTFMGTPAGTDGDMSLSVGPNMRLEPDPATNTIRIVVGSPVVPTRCVPPEQQAPPDIPEPPE